LPGLAVSYFPIRRYNEKRAESLPDRLERRPPYAQRHKKASAKRRSARLFDRMARAGPSLWLARPLGPQAMATTLSPLAALVNVAVGGAFGAVLRYQLGRSMTGWIGPAAMGVFPWATLAVNALGSLLMGVLAGWLTFRAGESGEQMRLLLGVGLLGGFTTFSAFSLEMVLLIERGQLLFAALYAFLSVALGITGLFAGLIVMRAVA